VSWSAWKAGSERSSVGVHMTEAAERRSRARGRPKSADIAAKTGYSAPRLIKLGDFARLTRGGNKTGHDAGGGGGPGTTHV
jgi:hypothetical protein